MSSDAAHPNPDVAKRLAHIYTLHRTDVDLRLGESPYIKLLEKLGSPHKKLAPVIHVAGTNGKGSVLAFLRAMLEHAGHSVHVYTSPHLVTFNERIRVNGNLISDAHLIELYDRVETANAGAPITFFEFTTAMAFLAFAENPADITLLETGMGGRLDCTNVIENPIVTAITKISFDHTEFLGNTLEAIAFEKAGIIKPGVPCVIGVQMTPEKVLPVFKKRAQELNAPLHIAERDWEPGVDFTPSLTGAHQIENAALAVEIASLLPENLAVQAVDTIYGTTHAQWPGRMQCITQSALLPSIPTTCELWFDAAHNDSGAMALAEQLRSWKKTDPDMPIHLVVGLAADKDVSAFFGALQNLYDDLTLVDLPQARKPQTAQDLKIKAALTNAHTASTVAEALKQAPKNGRVIVAGSLYLYQQL